MAVQPVKVNIAALNRYMSRIVQPFLLNKAREIAQEAKTLAPKGATGDLQGSIDVERGAKWSVVVNVKSAHAGYVHQGTGPQHRPDARSPYFPAIRKRGLMLWAMTKGLDPFKVAQGISKSGTPANPFLEDAMTRVLGKFHLRWVRKDLTR